MKKVLVIGEKKEEIIPKLGEYDFILVDDNSTDIDFIISYGGDGALIKSENAYPGIPKIPLRASKICKKCSDRSNEEVLAAIQKGDFEIQQMLKLEAKTKHGTQEAINEITVCNADQRFAIRYILSINDKTIGHEVIGDGIVVATPFGSTGYYRSITRSFIHTGIGLAINNSTEPFDHMVLKDDMSIDLKIVRGPANVYADNKDEVFVLNDGDNINIKKSENYAQIVVPKF